MKLKQLMKDQDIAFKIKTKYFDDENILLNSEYAIFIYFYLMNYFKRKIFHCK